MPDQSANPGLDGDESLLAAAQTLLGQLWGEAWALAPGTLAGEVEELHQMRVAVRRARSALECFEGAKSKPLVAPHLRRELRAWRRQLGDLGDALGAVRDCDVLTGYLDKFGENLEAGGFAQLRRRLLKERDAASVALARKIKKADRPNDLRKSFARFTLGLPAAGGPNPALRDIVIHILAQRQAEATALATTLDDPDDELGHHELRKSLKRLRYALEFFKPCVAKNPKAFIKQITRLQNSLGELQDRAVLRDKIRQVFGKGILPDDIAAFACHGEARQEKLLAKARRQWAVLSGDFLTSHSEPSRAR